MTFSNWLAAWSISGFIASIYNRFFVAEEPVPLWEYLLCTVCGFITAVLMLVDILMSLVSLIIETLNREI